MKTIIFFLVLSLWMACSDDRGQHDQKAEHADAHHDEKGDSSTVRDHGVQQSKQFTCPMHPSVVRDSPGQCPVCGMDLVPRTTNQASAKDLMLSESQIRLANITTAPARKSPVGHTIILNGQLTVDEQTTQVISSRADGRLEKLVVKETGQEVRKGHALYVLYSEELLTLQQEYLLAREQYETLGGTDNRYKAFRDAAEKKLRLYGLTTSQINGLSGQTMEPRVSFVAPSSGIVTEINAREGQYVTEGTMLYRVEDISTLWVEAELYPGEASLVKTGDKVSVTVSGSEGSPVPATVNFLSPEYRSNSQVIVLRAAIDNPEGRFKPGQFAQVSLTHSTHASIAVPVNAVIRDARGAHVYLRSGNNTFRPQMVKTGVAGFETIEITEGLSEFDTVAVTGAYLLYSEYILRQGSDPMAGHVH